MDIDLLEAYLSHVVEPDHATTATPSPVPPATKVAAGVSSSQLPAIVIGLGEMASHAREFGKAWRPRYSLLGPFMARFMQVGTPSPHHFFLRTSICKPCVELALGKLCSCKLHNIWL